MPINYHKQLKNSMIELEIAKLEVIYARLSIMLDRVFIAAETKGWCICQRQFDWLLEKRSQIHEKRMKLYDQRINIFED
jgi:hypothetical protein